MSSLSRPGWPGISDGAWRRVIFGGARRVVFRTALLACASVGVVSACGPDFPNRYFDLSEEAILAAPEGYFAAEVAHLALARTVPYHTVHAQADETPDTPFTAEGAEVERALRAQGVATAKARSLGEQFARARRELANAVEHGGELAGIALPAELPAEFRHYFLGARAWHQSDVATAEREWRAVLALPESERRHRSVWAAYMLGRAAEARAEAANVGEPAAAKAAAAEATAQFELARSLAGRGFADSQGLAAESYGREARALLVSGNQVGAINRYVDHYAAGSPGAVVSLRWSARELLDQPFTDEVVRDVATRRVLTAMIISRIGASAWAAEDLPFEKWAEDLATACERAGVNDAPEADRLAWLAYEGGKFELAERWVALAPAAAPHAAWIRAKLALRAGNLATGAQLLRAALDHTELSADHHARLSAELARVQLALNDYAGSLRTWLEGGHWEDAAFVAEHVLSADELRAFVDREVPEPRKTTNHSNEAQDAADVRSGLHGSLRGLLARRLARSHQYDAALAYFRDEDRPWMREYLVDMRLAFESTKPAGIRSAAYWRAAQLVREHGLELFGTELDPDWNIWGGYFQTGSASEDRKSTARPRGQLLAPTTDELARLEKARTPAQRFHYRYRAAEIAGWAAALLPNDSEEAAHILYTAGGWLKARDPEAANPFYRLLVIRCGNTPLGRAAAAKHWFPDDEAAAIAEFQDDSMPARPPAEPAPKRQRFAPKEALRPIQQRPGPRR